jgi:hypothetical protein
MATQEEEVLHQLTTGHAEGPSDLFGVEDAFETDGYEAEDSIEQDGLEHPVEADMLAAGPRTGSKRTGSKRTGSKRTVSKWRMRWRRRRRR